MELLVVIAIIGLLASLILPAVQSVRAAAARTKCASNLRQIGIASLNFESAFRGLPRAGEHLVTGAFGSGVAVYRTQDLQSALTMLLPYIEQEAAFSGYDLTKPYNYPGAAGNGASAQSRVALFLCPVNPLSTFRSSGGGKDSQGFGTTDYAPLPYVEAAPGLAPGEFAPSAMTGDPYEPNLYQKYLGSDSGTVSANKSVQLKTTDPANIGLIDAAAGLSKVTGIQDGSSNSILMFEDVGRNESMDGAGLVQEFYDPMTASRRRHWIWADPDNAAAIAQKVNNARGGSMNFPDSNVAATNKCFNKTWRATDCGPHNQPFSFHGGGAHFVFADGHIAYIRETAPVEVLKALGTRSNGHNERNFAYSEE